VRVEVGVDLGPLVRGEVRADLAACDARGEQVEAVLGGPDGRPGAPRPVPEPVDQACAEGLDRARELLDAASLDGGGDRVSADEVTEAEETVVASWSAVSG
jgi:hypothetical protein